MKTFVKLLLVLFLFSKCEKVDHSLESQILNISSDIELQDSSKVFQPKTRSFSNNEALPSFLLTGSNTYININWTDPFYDTECDWYHVKITKASGQIQNFPIYKNGSLSVYTGDETSFSITFTSTCSGASKTYYYDLSSPDESEYTCKCRKRYLKFAAKIGKNSSGYIMTLDNMSTPYQNEASSLFMAPKYYAVYVSGNNEPILGGIIPVEYGSDTRYGFIPPIPLDLPYENPIYGREYFLKLAGDVCPNNNNHNYFFTFSIAGNGGFPSPSGFIMGQDPDNPKIPY